MPEEFGNNKGKFDEPKKRSCLCVCCRAIFCCGSGGNTVSKEIELEDMNAALNKTTEG